MNIVSFFIPFLFTVYTRLQNKGGSSLLIYVSSSLDYSNMLRTEL